MSEVVTPQLSYASGAMPTELATLRALALDQHREVLEAREIVRCRNAYMGRLYEGLTVLPWKPACVHPKVHEVVERFTAILTDSRVKFEPKPRNDEDHLLAEMLIEATDYEWERQRMDLTMAVASRGVLIDGTEHLYTTIDPVTGQLATRILSPFSLVPDPATVRDDEMSYCLIQFSMTRTEIEAKWPEYARMIFDTVHKGSAPLRDENTFNQQFYDPRTNSPTFGTFGTAAQAAAGTISETEFSTPQQSRPNQGKRYKVVEWWFARGEDRELTVDLADGGQTTIELPSSNGRRLYTIEEHYFPELDGPNPFEHGQIPVSRMSAIQLLGEYMALPYVQPLLDTAEQLADIDNQIMANVRLMMHPIWLVPFESRIDMKKFFSAPGVVLPYRAPYKPEAHTAPALPNYVFQLRQIKQQEFDNTSGMNDISRGDYSGSLDDVSGKAVQLLQRPTYTRMRPIQMSLEYAVTRWGQQTMTNMMQYWPEPMWRRVLSSVFAPAPLPWLQAGPFGDRIPSNQFLPDIRMSAGSNLPENQDQRNGLAFNLYDRSAFGPPGSPVASSVLLKATQFPGADQIAENVKEALAQMPQPLPGAPPGGGNKALGADRGPAADQQVAQSLSGQEGGQ